MSHLHHLICSIRACLVCLYPIMRYDLVIHYIILLFVFIYSLVSSPVAPPSTTLPPRLTRTLSSFCWTAASRETSRRSGERLRSTWRRMKQ